MTGIIKSIKIYPAKGETGLEAHEAKLLENLGLEWDFHAKGGERQISLLFADNYINDQTRQEQTKQDQTKQGLCLSRFRENISVHFPEPVAIQAGTRLETEETVLEITGETKRCHEECPLYEAGKSCSLAGLNLFARVLKSGIIRKGERVIVDR